MRLRNAVFSQWAWLSASVTSAFLAAGIIPCHGQVPAESLRKSVVKIYVVIQRPDYSMPWQSQHAGGASGSGFIIGKRILTNAHIISNARFIEVQRGDDPRRFKAEVSFVGHDCDLATLSVADPLFFEDAQSLPLAQELPKLGDEVNVVGYPLGGTHLSMTRGVVSRIDYSLYTHSGVDQHLVLQVDAAINPGNSGGPVFYHDRVVGLAFQALSWAENIGYVIPVPVINHFLEDIADGKYHGYPELGASFMESRNPALRKDLKMPEKMTGIIVSYIDPFGAALGKLQVRDVLTAIDGYPIANDGSVQLAGNTILFAELLERKQWGQSITFKVWRDGKAIETVIPLANPEDPFIFRNMYGRTPPYFIVAGLVFCPLSRDYLRTVGRANDANEHRLLYTSLYAKMDNLYKDRDEFVVLSRRLPHPVNTYADDFLHGLVTEVNGRPIRNLSDVKEALAAPKDGFHVMRFMGMEDVLVLSAEQVSRISGGILTRYGVGNPENLRRDTP